MQSDTVSRGVFEQMANAFRTSIELRDEACDENDGLRQKLACASCEIKALKARIAALESVTP